MATRLFVLFNPYSQHTKIWKNLNSFVTLHLMLFYSLASLADPGQRIAGNTQAIHADGHAPIGVMGDHLHQAGEWMISYRFMQMSMQDNLVGNDSISPEQIVSTLSNPFTGPANVRVVLTDMDTQVHMFGFMYAFNDDFTFMGMLSYIQKEMGHITFQGMAGTSLLGTFTTKSSGVGDIKLTGLHRLFTNDEHHFHLNFGISLPTGKTNARDKVLTPMNTQPELKLPYAMQLGSGTYDLRRGLKPLAS